MNIGILKNNDKENALFYTQMLMDDIRSCGAEFMLLDDTTDNLAGIDMVISVGGDGTFLKAACAALSWGIPIFGLNLGTLGMLTEFDKDNIGATVARLVAGDYSTEERPVMDVTVNSAAGDQVFQDYAINDCVVTQFSLSKMAYIQLYIDGYPVEMYPCDGIIVSTQTGSTAYSLSAGGPIVMPGCNVMVVTPKCPHFTDGRSIIVNKDAEVRLKLAKHNREMVVSVDGRSSYKMEGNEVIYCRMSDVPVKIVRIDPPNFFHALKTKIERREEKLKD